MAESRFAKLAARKAAEIEAEAASEPLFLAVEDDIRQDTRKAQQPTVKPKPNPVSSIPVLQDSRIANLPYNRIAGNIDSSEERNMQAMNAANAVIMEAERPAVKKNYRSITVRVEVHHDDWMNERAKSRGVKKQDIVNASLVLYRQFAAEGE